MTSKHCHLEAASAICSRLWVLAASHPRYFQELKNSLQSRHHTDSPMNGWLNGKCSCNANKLLRRCVIMSGVAQWLACWAHNPKVRGSKPRSAIFFLHLLREMEHAGPHCYSFSSGSMKLSVKSQFLPLSIQIS